LLLLPDADERDDELSERVRIAYSHGLEDAVLPADIERLGAAQRLESLYQLLDGGEVHFRFDPGDLAQLGTEIQPGSGSQLELILLEYARISDELEGFPDLSFLEPNAVPQWVDPSRSQATSQKVLAEIDGRSTIQEIGDRLAWPTRQTRLTLAGLFQTGALRLSTHQELLALTLYEMEARQFARACQRLRAWVRACPPGPMHPEAARILSEEWVSGRLPASMRGMQPKETRAMLRRLDASIGNPTTAVSHWNEAVQIHPEDAVCRMHAMSLQYAEDDRSDKPSVRDLLALARKFKEDGTPARGAPLLLIAVQKKPEGLGQKLEVGLGLLEAGQPEHGGPWVLAAAHSLVDRGQADRALAPLRLLIQAYPQSREAKALLSKAKRASTQAKKLRRNMLIGGAALALLGAGAMVKVRTDQVQESHLAEVRALIDTPEAALASLNRHFPDNNSSKVLQLRRRIEDSQRSLETKTKDAWLDLYKEAQEAAKNQAPDAALQVIRALPTPPKLTLVKDAWPSRGDLYDLMGKRLVSEVNALGEVRAFAEDQVSMEARLQVQSQQLLEILLPEELKLKEVGAMQAGVRKFQLDLEARSKARKLLELQEIHRKNLNYQDQLRDQAEQAVAAGDFDRALNFYEEILQDDLDPRVRDFIQPQVDSLRNTIQAIAEARELSNRGLQREALALLEARIPTREHFEGIILPWKVQTYPEGAKVTLSSGRTYTTPFEIETRTIEALSLHFTCPGFEPYDVEVTQPGDVMVYMTRTPQTAWQASGRVDAVPVPFEKDHIVVDRGGSIARIRGTETEIWRKAIPTLSGVARAPVFFPGGSDKLLLVTEEGSAWLVSASDGALEGPWELGSPPRVGPLANSNRVHVLLANGRWSAWKEALQPEPLAPDAQPYDEAACATYRYGPNNGMQVLRSREGEVSQLKSRFTGWQARVEEDRLLVTPPSGEPGFSAHIEGRWTFLAWEPATTEFPQGRLWLSDDFGLRGFIPRSE